MVFKKLYFKIEFVKAFIAKNFIFLIIGLLVGGLASYFRPRIEKLLASTQSNVQIIGINRLYTSTKFPSHITNLISYGLTSTTENNRYIISPLVEKWTVDSGNQNYTFTLKPNTFWHDGKMLSAHNIDYLIPGIQFKAVNDTTLKVTTDTPFAGLFSLLSRPLITKDLIGVGPYQVTKITYQDSYVKELRLQSLENKSKYIVYRFFSDDTSLISAYKMGQIDTIYRLDNPGTLINWPKTEIVPSLDYQQYSAIFINSQKIKDKKIRQALSYATPKTKNKKDRCLGPISPSSWAYNNTIKEYNFNATRAKELFDLSALPKINISLNDRRLLPMAEEIKSSWNSILGITATISIEKQIDKENYDVILAFAEIPSDPDQYQFWHSTQSTNLTKINNPRIDKLLEEGRLTFDIQERKRIYLDFQKFLLEENPAIFLSYPTVYSVNRLK